MSYTLDHFETIRQRFPSWTDLRAYLESDAGGKIRVVEQEGSPLVVLRYVKSQSDLRTPELGVGLFRSVVWNTETNLPVSVAPPKAREGLPPVGVQLSATEDFVDGFMINAWTDATGQLEIATRTQIGGDNTFYGETSFGEMFDEALAASPLKDRAGLATALGTSSFASFVVQHPSHRVVAKVTAPSLAVVHVGQVQASGAVKISERAVNWPQLLGRFQISSYALKRFSSEEEIRTLLQRTAVQRGWRWQGLVFKDGSGGRWRLRSPTYEKLRALRGSEAAAADRFLRLRDEGNVVEYLKHYGDERNQFWAYEQALRARTKDIVAAYADVHKAHSVAFKDLPEAYQPAVFRLHALFLEKLREKGYKVRLQNAVQVVREMPAFEKRRLLDAEPYEAAAAPVAESESAN